MLRALAMLVVTATAASASAQPEMRGTHAFSEWDAGPLPFAGTMIRTRVYYPNDPGPFPVVGVIHGATRSGDQHVETARTFASRGFVVLLPDLPCLSIGGCDHDANASQIIAMLDWGVAQSDDPTSRLHGTIDGGRRGLVGHSWGALASHLAAARDPRILSIALFDPNDDGTVGRDATAAIAGSEASLLAEVGGVCNSQWDEAMITPRLAPPRLQLTISRSAHCDPEDPGDGLCPLLCGAGDPATRIYFRRYAVAWTECILTGDAAVADWLGGAEMTADTSASIIEGVVADGLDLLPCRSGLVPGLDGGLPGADTGPAIEADAGTSELDAGGSIDAGSTSGTDAGRPSDAGTTGMDGGAPRVDGGSTGRDAGSAVAPTAGSCGCSVPGSRARWEPAAATVLALAVLALAARRRAPR